MDILNTINTVKVSGSSGSSVKKFLKEQVAINGFVERENC